MCFIMMRTGSCAITIRIGSCAVMMSFEMKSGLRPLRYTKGLLYSGPFTSVKPTQGLFMHLWL